MRALSIREVRAALGRIEEIVEEEGELLITRHGKPVARIVPLDRVRPIPPRRALRESMPPLPVSSAELIRRERDER